MWAKVQAFLASKSITTHSIAGVYVFLVGAYATVPAWKALVDSSYAALPTGVKEISLAAIGLIAWYRSGQKSN